MPINIFHQEERMKRIGYLFYLIDPGETLFSSVSQVPNYITEAIPCFVGLILIEQLLAFCLRKDLLKVNDAITSAGQGLLMEQSKVLLPGFIIVYYKHIYDFHRVIDLPSNSYVIWLLALLLIDFLFYWFHRACHEVNILWATHQVHHSSEHFNLSTALRQSIPQVYLHILFYLPLALFLPPTLYLVHFELNTLFQFWIHTEILNPPKLIGYIINTPSHHRVHHGRNRYCIDKNYASVLIIWDRIFGTFCEEKEPVVYGLTHPVKTFNPITLQVHSYQHLWTRLKLSNSWSEFLSILFKGPGWEPGKPRLGFIEDIEDVTRGDPRLEPYNPQISHWSQAYCCVHFLIILVFHILMTQNTNEAMYKLIISFLFILLSLTSLGMLMDTDPNSNRIEFIRCLLFFCVQDIYLPPNSTTLQQFALCVTIRAVYYISIATWIMNLIPEKFSVVLKAHKKSC